MEIKRFPRKSWTLITAEKIWHNRSRRLFLFLLLLYTLVIFAFGAAVYSTGIHTKIQDNAHLIPRIPINFVRGLFAKPEHLTIDIKHEDFMKLAYQREIALAKGHLVVGEDDYVPATIRYDDESVEARIRLKGDFLDHLNTDKWSFRIKVRGDNALFGMKQFSIQHPKTRNYVYEWIYHQALKREDVVALRYQFIDVTLNGKDLGVYALEEHFEKRLIEHNQLREGPIVRFNENLMLAERFQQKYPFPGTKVNGNSTYFAADIDTFQTGEMLSDPSSYAQHTQAIYLLESFRRGDLETSDVFDIQKLARFFAINDLMGAQHSTNWQNLRFYYNPITSRLEPVGFDGDSGHPIKAISKDIGPEAGIMHIEAIFSDRLFFEEYVRALERISEPSYLDTLLAELSDELEQNLEVLYSEFLHFDSSMQVLYRNQRYIRTVLNPIKGLHAYYHQSSKDQIELELGNIQSMPVEVLSVSYQDSVLVQPVRKTILPETPALESEPVDYQIASFTFPRDFVWSEAMINDLKVNYRLLGTSRMRQGTVFPWSYLGENFVDNDLIRQEPNVDAFDFLVTDDTTQEIRIRRGTWNLDQDLIIPKGYRVIGGEGTQLNLSNSARILSYAPLELIGSEDDPIVIQSTDSTGQGIVVMNADQTSVLENVTFNNLSNPSQGGWELTGAVTFYESAVRISHSKFASTRAEDALN
ncbi:MAG: CotH kinase family protein, partial [Candidatus Hermodarchaeia archaeon]